MIQTITLENSVYNYNIHYNGKKSSDIPKYAEGIPSEMKDPDLFREIILFLLSNENKEIKINNIECEIQVTYLQKNTKKSWVIEIIPNYNSNEKINMDLFQIIIQRKFFKSIRCYL